MIRRYQRDQLNQGPMKILHGRIGFKAQSLRSAQRCIVKPPTMLDRAFRRDVVEQRVNKVHKRHFEVGSPQLHYPRQNQTTKDRDECIVAQCFKGVLRQGELCKIPTVYVRSVEETKRVAVEASSIAS